LFTKDTIGDYLLSVKLCYRVEAIETLDFWCQHGIDWEKGGISTFVNRDGSRWGWEKSGWFQGRSLYSFAKGYNDIMQKPEWLEAAHSLYRFLIAHNPVPDDPHGKMLYWMDRAARDLIRDGIVSEDILNRIEMAVRAYDPCISCSTHGLDGGRIFEVTVRDARGNKVTGAA
jgi:hypothetical protein